jgi:hypothetical protein
MIASSTKYPFAFISSPKPIFLRIVYALSLMPIPAPTATISPYYIVYQCNRDFIFVLGELIRGTISRFD